MNTELTRSKIDWLEGLLGVRRRRLAEVMKKPGWPAVDCEQKQRDIEMIERLVDDYRRVLARQLEHQEKAA